MADMTNNKVFDLIECGEKLDLFKKKMKETGGLTQVLKDMVEHSEIDPNSPYVMERVKGRYDIEGRFSQANLPSGYSFDEMNRPLGVSGSEGPTIDIQDILQQRKILQMDVDKMHGTQSVFGSDYQGTKTEDLNKVLNSMHKLSYMIDESVDWSQEDTDREKNLYETFDLIIDKINEMIEKINEIEKKLGD